MAERRRVKISILPTAKTDLQEIVDFIARGSRRYAILEKRVVIAAIEKLTDFPDIGKLFDYKGIDARQFIFRNYLIIYRYKTEELLEVLTGHHHARSITNNPAFTDED